MPDSSQTSKMSVSLLKLVPRNAGTWFPREEAYRLPVVYQASAPERAKRSTNFAIDRGIVQRFAAALAQKHSNRHTPNPLPRDAPIRTPSDHVCHALFAPRRVPLHFLDVFQRPAAQSSAAVHLASMEMNHCSVARKMMGLWQRQQCGYECSSFSECSSAPRFFSSSMIGALASQTFSPSYSGSPLRRCRAHPRCWWRRAHTSRRWRNLPRRAKARCAPRRCRYPW